jgi:hypothetical protein
MQQEFGIWAAPKGAVPYALKSKKMNTDVAVNAKLRYNGIFH